MRATLHPRLHIDIEPADLVWALERCAHRRDEAWDAGDWLVTRSVRSAFDLYLSALALPAGSEVVMTGLTVPDMWRLVRLHGLVPVPVDLDAATMAPSVDEVRRVLSPKTRLIVAAHLLGGRFDMEPLAALAAEAGVPLVEDLAQAWTGPESRGHEASALWLFSFGSLKTSTALGGGLARARDEGVRRAMRALHEAWPRQPTAEYAKKVGSFLALAGARGPHRFRALERACAASAISLDGVLRQVTRGFPAEEAAFLSRVRVRPCAALEALLHRRLTHFDAGRLERRTRAGEWLRARVGCVGAQLRERTHWLYAIETAAPERLVERFRSEGFDAARGTSTIDVVPGRPLPKLERLLAGLVFIPAYPEVPRADLERLARLVETER